MQPDSSPKPKRRNVGLVQQRSMAWPLDPDPTMPAPYDKSDLAALKALNEGRAEPYQQQLVLQWLVYACGTYENPYRPGGEDGRRATDFAAAKQMIGQQIVKLINLPAADADQGEQG